LYDWDSFAPASFHHHHFLATKVYRKLSGFSSSSLASPKRESEPKQIIEHLALGLVHKINRTINILKISPSSN
jgi:hypothetical protein